MSQEVDVAGSADVVERVPFVAEATPFGSLALVRLGGQVYALENACPHRGGELGRGDVQGTHLFCPLHGWSFDVRTGEAFFPRGARVRAFEAREAAGRVLVRPRQGLP